MKLIIITGTPGTGKSTLAKFLAKKLGWERLDLHKYYSNLSTRYNPHKKCWEIDFNKLKKLVTKKLKESKKNLILDSHISHQLPKKMVNLCIVLTSSNLKILEKRLKQRKYSPQKIRENLDSEIFQVCLNEAKENGSKLKVIDIAKENSLLKQWIKVKPALLTTKVIGSVEKVAA